jgi:hypothetical protein
MQKKSALPLNDPITNKKKVQLCSKESLVKILRWHFGYSDFRGMQLEAIQTVLSGAIQIFLYRFNWNFGENGILIIFLSYLLVIATLNLLMY